MIDIPKWEPKPRKSKLCCRVKADFRCLRCEYVLCTTCNKRLEKKRDGVSFFIRCAYYMGCGKMFCRPCLTWWSSIMREGIHECHTRFGL